MSGYLRTIYDTKGYIEKLSLWIKIKQKNLETGIDHAPTCVRFVRKRGRGHCTFPSKVTIPRQKRVNYIQGFDITVLTDPSLV